MNLQPFSHDDWDGFAAAERFPDGSEPLISHEYSNGVDLFIVIVDAKGIYVLIMNDDFEKNRNFIFDTGHRLANELIVRGLAPEHVTPQNLLSIGFTEI